MCCIRSQSQVFSFLYVWTFLTVWKVNFFSLFTEAINFTKMCLLHHFCLTSGKPPLILLQIRELKVIALIIDSTSTCLFSSNYLHITSIRTFLLYFQSWYTFLNISPLCWNNFPPFNFLIMNSVFNNIDPGIHFQWCNLSSGSHLFPCISFISSWTSFACSH